MQFRRYYSAKARQLLSNAFQRMEKPGYVKSEAQRKEIVDAAKELNIAPSVASQAYDSAVASGSGNAGANAGASGSGKNVQPNLSAAQRQKLAQQTDVDMFGPPKSEQYESSEFQYDDLPSLAHLHLEEHRTAREFIRSAAYELPLLSQYRSQYRAPKPTENLRFKHYSFPKEENHPASTKVVLAFTPESTNIAPENLHKLKLLAGRRFDSEKNEIRISANQFGTQAQNKHYLAQIYSKLLAAASEGEKFDDVALDQRHVVKRMKKQPTKVQWPEEWSRPDLAPKQKEDIYSVIGSSVPKCT